MTDHSSARRHFLIKLAVAATAGPIVGRLVTQDAQAALPKLPATNAQAQALNYTADASKVRHPMYKAGSTCANCQLFTAGTSACAIFPGFAVEPKGWCSAWAKKA